MAKHLHLRVAGKLYAVNNYRDIPVMLEELFDIGDDCIDFIFAHDCELTEKQIWIKEFLILLIEKAQERLRKYDL
jgi:hypothetical protein